MNPGVFFISHTGNTKRFAEAIAEKLKAPLFDIATTSPSEVAAFDLLLIGTPTTGGKPAPELSAFINRMPQSAGKKAILFCTYAFMKGGTFKAMEQGLSAKGYETILSVAKRGIKPSKAEFTDALNEISKALEKQQR
jgi:flavodoxin